MKNILYTIFLSFSFLLVSCSDSDADSYNLNIDPNAVCKVLLEYEKKRNQSLPIMVDEITEWSSFSIDCKHKTAYTNKKVTIDYRTIKPEINLDEWKAHQQRIHTINNCNPNEGLSSVFGWSTVDNVVDYNGHLFTLITRPSDCNYMKL